MLGNPLHIPEPHIAYYLSGLVTQYVLVLETAVIVRVFCAQRTDMRHRFIHSAANIATLNIINCHLLATRPDFPLWCWPGVRADVQHLIWRVWQQLLRGKIIHQRLFTQEQKEKKKSLPLLVKNMRDIFRQLRLYSSQFFETRKNCFKIVFFPF